jgi:uncharacterized membrane protein YgaE (UPF0421/DUF939 family)
VETSNNDAFVYSSKAAISAVVALICSNAFNLPGAIWAPVSAVIVTQAALHPSFKASLLRIAANLIGAFIGALVNTCIDNTLVAMGVGVLITGLVCHFGRMDDATRPAFAAVVIVTIKSEPHAWAGSLDRVLAVTLGCMAALAVGLVFDGISRMVSKRKVNTSTAADQHE